MLDFQENIVTLYLRPQNSQKSRPPKAADFFGSFFVFCTIISWEPKIKNAHIEYISWNIFFFEVQLCIQKSIFNEFCGILGIWQIGCRVASSCWAALQQLGHAAQQNCYNRHLSKCFSTSICKQTASVLRHFLEALLACLKINPSGSVLCTVRKVDVDG